MSPQPASGGDPLEVSRVSRAALMGALVAEGAPRPERNYGASAPLYARHGMTRVTLR